LPRVDELTKILDALWPREWAESWDNVGLLVGDPAAEVRRCFVALDADRTSVQQAISHGAELLVSHHPMPFAPQRNLVVGDPSGDAIVGAIQGRLNIYAAHTNLDVSWSGPSQSLADILRLRSPTILKVTGHQDLYKVAVFVPAGHEDGVLRAMADAGAGQLGNYSHCSFAAPGTGTFLPLEGARPFLGQVGTLQRQSELRLEVLVPSSKLSGCIRAMTAAHPYEEVAYDIVRLDNPGPPRGYGLVGELSRAARLRSFTATVARALDAPATRFLGDPERSVRRVAVVGGAGASFIADAAACGADVLVTADVRYHQARDAEDRGLAVVDPGHHATEAPVVPVMAEALRQACAAEAVPLEIILQVGRPDPWMLPHATER